MAKVIEKDGVLTLRLSRLEKIGALHGDISVAGSQLISKSEVPNPWKSQYLKGVRAPGTAIPYRILLGTMRYKGGKDFTMIYGNRPVEVFEFKSGPYKRWIISQEK